MATEKKDRKTLLGILDKLGIEHSEKISAQRAEEKLTRALEKGEVDLSETEFSTKELALLKKLGWEIEEDGEEELDEEELKAEAAADEDEADEDEDGEEEEEEEAGESDKKKSKKKSKKAPAQRREGSNQAVMNEMVKAGESDKKILAKFKKIYADKDVDEEWIQKRVDIYKQIAKRELGVE